MKRVFQGAIEALKADPMLRWGVAAWMLAALALALRIPFGASPTDEPYYSAITYGFLLGNKPFKDELAFHQNAAVLMIPPFRIYTWLFGPDGLVVFNRWLYFAYIGLCSFLSFRLVKKLTSAASGAWAAALVLTFSYFNIFALSYNTLGAFGIFAGSLLSAEARLDKPQWRLPAALVFFATAAFSYPTLACVAALQSVLALVRLWKSASSSDFRRTLFTSALTSLVVVVLLGLFLAWVTPAGVQRALAYTRSLGYGSTAAALLPNSHFRKLTPYIFGYALVFLVSPVLLRRVARATWPLIACVPLSLLLLYWGSGQVYTTTRAQILLTAIPVLSPVCLYLAPSFRHRRVVLEQLLLPAVVSMLAVSQTSANAAMATHLGALPAVVAAVIAVSALTSELAARTPAAGWLYPWFGVATWGAALVSQLHTLFSGVYFDSEPLTEHTTLVRRGPLRGALATPTRARLLEAVDADLKSIDHPGKTLAVFDDFVPGYLSTHLRPRVFTHWVLWVFQDGYGAKLAHETYGNPADQPDYVLIFPTLLDRSNAFKPYLINYAPIIDRPLLGYFIEQRVASNPLPPPRPPRRHRRRPAPLP